MLQSFIDRFRTSRWWVQAIELTSDRNYTAALSLINDIERILDRDPRVTKNKVYARLLKSFLLYELGQTPAADRAASEAEKFLESAPNITPEIKYLLCYASDLRMAFKEQPKLDHQEMLRRYSSVNLDEISASVKRNFPLRNHPTWKNSGQ